MPLPPRPPPPLTPICEKLAGKLQLMNHQLHNVAQLQIFIFQEKYSQSFNEVRKCRDVDKEGDCHPKNCIFHFTFLSLTRKNIFIIRPHKFHSISITFNKTKSVVLADVLGLYVHLEVLHDNFLI